MEPACAVLEISPSTYYAAKKQEENPSVRDVRDGELKEEIMRVWKKKGRRVYGARKVWRELNREGITVARCTVERLMGDLGIADAAARRKRPRTTVPGPAGQERPSDLLEREVTAPAPNRRWVADITYVEVGRRGRLPWAPPRSTSALAKAPLNSPLTADRCTASPPHSPTWLPPPPPYSACRRPARLHPHHHPTLLLAPRLRTLLRLPLPRLHVVRRSPTRSAFRRQPPFPFRPQGELRPHGCVHTRRPVRGCQRWPARRRRQGSGRGPACHPPLAPAMRLPMAVSHPRGSLPRRRASHRRPGRSRGGERCRTRTLPQAHRELSRRGR